MLQSYTLSSWVNMLGISSPHASGNIHKEVVPIDRHTGVSGQAIMAETEVYDESQNLVGFKTLLTFMEGKQGAETRKTKWKMQEFRINQPPKPVKKRSHDKVVSLLCFDPFMTLLSVVHLMIACFYCNRIKTELTVL